MNWGAFDLNLLIVFDAVMQERSVTRAGSKIGLSQPAVSHALSRLRYMLKDELFIRTPDGMAPTPRAEQLAGPLRRALSDMQLALEPETFVPQEATRLFVLALNNCGCDPRPVARNGGHFNGTGNTVGSTPDRPAGHAGPAGSRRA
jgi:DNA-binding transcriptional LysR family regulator